MSETTKDERTLHRSRLTEFEGREGNTIPMARDFAARLLNDGDRAEELELVLRRMRELLGPLVCNRDLAKVIRSSVSSHRRKPNA